MSWVHGEIEESCSGPNEGREGKRQILGAVGCQCPWKIEPLGHSHRCGTAGILATWDDPCFSRGLYRLLPALTLLSVKRHSFFPSSFVLTR